MYIAYKFRIYPNDEQKVLINKNFGCARFDNNKYILKYEKRIKRLQRSLSRKIKIKNYLKVLQMHHFTK